MHTGSAPFRSELTPAENAHETMWEFVAYPSHFIRTEDNVLSSGDTYGIPTLSLVRDLLGELRRDYEIKNPGYWPVICEGEGANSEQAIIVTARVHGVGLPKAIEDNVPGLLDEVDTLYCSLARYLGDKYESRKPYMGDIFASHQYMYGRTEDNSKNGIILVDIGANVGADYSEIAKGVTEKHSEFLASQDDLFICLRATQLYEDVTSISRKTSKQFKAYEVIMRLLNSFVIESSHANEVIALINGADAHGKFVAEEIIQTLQEDFLESE